MAESIQLITQPRAVYGTRKARKLRQQGLIPAVIYGHKEETVSVTLPKEDFYKAVRRGVRVLDLKTNGKTEKALIRDIQWDHLGHDILHVDFTRVSADERIVVEVRLEVRGIAPGATGGGLLDQPLHAIQIECPAMSVPESIRVNINELQLGQAIYVRDLHLPEGVLAKTDPDAIVVHITLPLAAPEAPVVIAGPAEPEVIGRKLAEGEEAAEEKK